MRAGTCIDERFELRARAGAGGMGMVFHAHDRATGEMVAVKMLQHPRSDDALRFAREARTLARLAHPHVVRYVTHGVAPSGEPYLVMEWLAGESLQDRLARQSLGVAESVELARRVAGALGAAHAHGIVHRDIKPSNLFLHQDSIQHIKVLDFGVARVLDTQLTRTGLVLGTPGYMAPEQARGDQAGIDARADVFSLGCVLFECLTGRPAFQGAHMMAVLAKLLLEEPPRARALRPDVPPELDELIALMLAKSPDARPGDGEAVVAALDALGAIADDATPPPPPASSAAISIAERRLISVVAVDVPVDRTVSAMADTMITAPEEARLALYQEIRRIAALLGARAEELAAGGVVVMLVGAGNATDQAAVAARCALAVAAAAPGEPVALVTGWSEDADKLVVGSALDRAASLLDGQAGEGGGGVRIDEITHALLDARFHVTSEGGQLVLRGERLLGDEARILLGKPSPFVGRDRELRHLLELVEDSIAERQALAMLVTAPAGMGKSRLRHELVRRVKERHPELIFAMARGDSVGAGSAHAMVAGAIRSTLDLATGDPLEVQQNRVMELVREVVAAPEQQRVAEFLGELVGVPFPDEGSPALRAARRNPHLMPEHIRAAFVEFLRGATAARPVLVVLEDLQWGDGPSARLVDDALRELEERPLAVVALARPEVREAFPGLWTGRNLQELRLHGLSRRAAAEFIDSALGHAAGPGVSASQRDELIDRAGGNAFYLEELVRAVAEGRGDALPETVLGMVEARLSALDADARRLLRAASFFGQTFCAGGAMALLSDDTSLWREVLDRLVEREILARLPERRFAGEEQYVFRHALLRDGAYAMLTTRDRVAGHRLAGAWLLEAGEQDAMVLAEHFERGGDGAQAAACYGRAADQARRGGDLAAAIERVERGLALAPDVATRVELHVIDAQIRFWCSDYAGAYDTACRVLELETPGSASFWAGLAAAVISTAYMSRHDDFARLAGLALSAPINTDDAAARIAVTFRAMSFAFLGAGKDREAEVCLRRMEGLAPRLGHDAYAMVWVEELRAEWQRFVLRDHWGALQHERAAVRGLELVGETIDRRYAMTLVAMDLTHLGAFAEAEATLARILDVESKADNATWRARAARARLYLEQGRPEEAVRLARDVVEHAAAQDNRYLRFAATLIVIGGLTLLGRVDEAEGVAQALGPPGALPLASRAALWTAWARIRLRQGRAEDALGAADEALAANGATRARVYDAHDGAGLVRAEVLHALGQVEAARDAIAALRADVLARAERIEDPAYRQSFLEAVPVNARVLERARAWLAPA